MGPASRCDTFLRVYETGPEFHRLPAVFVDERGEASLQLPIMKVTFTNSDQVVEASEGSSILDLAEENHLDLDHACGGNCSCATCHVMIEAGMEFLSPMEDDEAEMLEGVRTPKSRLGCQARIVKSGDIRVSIPE